MNQPPDHESAGDKAETTTTESAAAPSEPNTGAENGPTAADEPEPKEPEPKEPDRNAAGADGSGAESPGTGEAGKERRPSFLFLITVSLVTLVADLGTKWWALHSLEKPLPNGGGISTPVELTPWLTLLLARNRGGAWGLLQSANEEIRKPFFLIISVAAIAFIVYLYRRVHPKQHALKWGLPLVLGGAVGNLVDRVRYGWVIDFIDYRAEWVRWLNQQIAKVWSSHAVTDHWPTFNIADVAICIGVGLMAIDMFTSRKITAAEGLQDKAATDNTPASEPSSVPPGSVPSGTAASGSIVSDSDVSSKPAESEAPPEQSKV